MSIFLLSLLSTPIALLTPLPLKVAIDSAINSDPLPGWLAFMVPSSWIGSGNHMLIVAVSLMIGVAVLSQLQSAGRSLLTTYTGEKLVLSFRTRLFRHAQRLSLTYHDTEGTADAIYRIQNDSQAIKTISIEGVIPFISSAVTLLSTFYVTYVIDPALALVALAVSPFLFLLTRVYRRKLRPRYSKVKKIDSESISVVHETFGALRVVKAFGQEDKETGRFRKRSDEVVKARLGLAVIQGNLGLLLGLVSAIGSAAVLYVGVKHINAGTLTVGSLILVMGYISQLYGPLRTVSRKIAAIQEQLAGADRAYSLLDRARDVVEMPDACAVDTVRGDISFEAVSFAYDGRNEVIHDVSFSVRAGEKVGIAGETGAGKTTLINLMMRFYDPDHGQVLLDDLNLRSYKVDSLRSQFALVLQEPVLFSATIAENIRYAREGAGFEDVVDAATAANAHGFIMTLPDGYDTEVGERGMSLSGGERQRIALARAFLKDSPILILDEPTSSVDVGTEAGIMEAVERLMEGRTTFLITHRIKTLETCDRLLVIDSGGLVVDTSDVQEAIGRLQDRLVEN